MGTQENIEKVLNENNIKFLKGNKDNDNVYNLPYKGFENKSYHINVFMEIIEEFDIVRFMLIEKANKEIDINAIKSSLLDLNSMLKFGILSMRNESDTIEYKVDYKLGDEGFEFDQYIDFVILCLKMYETLKKDNLIE